MVCKKVTLHTTLLSLTARQAKTTSAKDTERVSDRGDQRSICGSEPPKSCCETAGFFIGGLSTNEISSETHCQVVKHETARF